MKFVIDTNILIKAFNNRSLDCFALAGLFYANADLLIVFDSGEGVIEQEYRQNLADNEMYQKWLVAMFNGNKILYVSGKLNAKIRKKLLALGFHEPTDQTFVATALNSDKNIISEDSDYGKGDEDKANDPAKKAVLRYMTQDLGLNVMDSEDGLAFINETD